MGVKDPIEQEQKNDYISGGGGGDTTQSSIQWYPDWSSLGGSPGFTVPSEGQSVAYNPNAFYWMGGSEEGGFQSSGGGDEEDRNSRKWPHKTNPWKHYSSNPAYGGGGGGKKSSEQGNQEIKRDPDEYEYVGARPGMWWGGPPDNGWQFDNAAGGWKWMGKDMKPWGFQEGPEAGRGLWTGGVPEGINHQPGGPLPPVNSETPPAPWGETPPWRPLMYNQRAGSTNRRYGNRGGAFARYLYEYPWQPAWASQMGMWQGI